MRRRDFITLLGGAAAVWPVVARAQSTMPVIGFLHSGSSGPNTSYSDAFRRGLGEMGYAQGRNLQIEYRWAEGQFDRLPSLAADLVRRTVAVLVAGGGTVSVLAAKHATSTIPIVFPGVDDPVKMGIVQSFNRPGGNATGVSLFNAVLTPKRLEILRELVPNAASVALLINPKNPSTESQVSDVQGAAQVNGLKVRVLSASTEVEIDAGYATLTESRADVFIVGADPLFQTLRNRLIALAARYATPSIYLNREFPLSGGLISYGVDFPDNYRQAGSYTGRILKGEKPGDLPVVQPTKFELVINLKTAKALGLTIPPTLLARADEVIE
jgi:putative ABC transport system substrate-binding protein